MTLFLHHVRRRWYVFPAMCIAVISMLIINRSFYGFHSADLFFAARASTGTYPFVLAGLFCCFILYSRDETEMAAVYGTSPLRLVIYQYVPIVVSAYIPAAVFGYVLFKDIWPVLFLSYAITLLFLTGLSLLCRLLFNNIYASVGLAAAVIYIFNNNNTLIKKGHLPIERALYDPFITTFYGARWRGDGGVPLELPPGIWEQNCVLFSCVAVVILILCVILAKMERVYR